MNVKMLVLMSCSALLMILSCGRDNKSEQFEVRSLGRDTIDSARFRKMGEKEADFPVCLKTPMLAALIPCAIMELGLDGDLESKKQDCIDSLNRGRNISVLRASPVFHPVYLPSLLEESEIFKERYAVSVVVEGDSLAVLSRFSSFPVEIKNEYQGWRVSVNGWLDSVESEKTALAFSKLLGGLVASKNRANGAIALGVCLSAQDSVKLAQAANLNEVPIKFVRISYSREDVDDLTIVEEEE